MLLRPEAWHHRHEWSLQGPWPSFDLRQSPAEERRETKEPGSLAFSVLSPIKHIFVNDYRDKRTWKLDWEWLLSKSSWFYGNRNLLPGKGLAAQCTQKPIMWHWLLRKIKALLRGQPARRQEAELRSVSQIGGSVKLFWVGGRRLVCGSTGERVSIGGLWNLAL